MANTDGGGALIVGVADDGQLIGTAIDGEWLRARIYELTNRLLTVEVRVTTVRGHRLLVIRSPQAIEPIRHRGRITWRLDDRCVEVDATTWHARRMVQARYDWSSMSSHVEPREVRPGAVDLARTYLRASGESPAADLADAPQPDLLRRLNVVTPEGYLTNAGVLAFVGRSEPGLDYIRREYASGDSLARVRSGDRSLIEEVAEVERTLAAYNGVRHVQRGLVVGQVRDLPPLAVREAIVNGIVHRDWASSDPTVVEHVGRSLVVSSPGGFVGGVTPDNIITHPSQARNRALAELFAALRLAEREGIGVDRMVREMISVGHARPEIIEEPGPRVRTALVGERLDEAWIRFLVRLVPDRARQDLNLLLLLTRLVSHGWVDVTTAAPLLQRTAVETEGALASLADVRIDGRDVIEHVAGVPVGDPPAWRLSRDAVSALADEDDAIGNQRPVLSRAEIALDWARSRGRVSTTELASIVGAESSNVGSVLKGLEEHGDLAPSRPSRRGRGFYYVPIQAAGGQP